MSSSTEIQMLRLTSAAHLGER